jgi:NAD(P)-dependent dehydrogenase (short-subunit alcohol dehydrogenase family)
MTKSPFDLTGKVAVVTGSSRGIGRASAELLAQLGAQMVVLRTPFAGKRARARFSAPMRRRS